MDQNVSAFGEGDGYPEGARGSGERLRETHARAAVASGMSASDDCGHGREASTRSDDGLRESQAVDAGYPCETRTFDEGYTHETHTHDDDRPRETRAPDNDRSRETRAGIDALAALLTAGHEARARGELAPVKRAIAKSPQRPPAPDPASFTPDLGRCEAHGPYALNTMDADGTLRWHSPGCPACARERATRALLDRAAVAPRFAHCTFENFVAASDAQRANLAACRRYAEEFGERLARGACLILRGAPGTGKNHLATAIARVLLARGHTVLNATAYELVRRIRETWRTDTRGDMRGGERPVTERALIQEFAAVDLLIIDEAGRLHEARDGGEPIELFHLIDARYRALKPTMVISNLDAPTLEARLGEAAYDRLREGGGRLLNFDWESHRSQAGKAQAMQPQAMQGGGMQGTRA